MSPCYRHWSSHKISIIWTTASIHVRHFLFNNKELITTHSIKNSRTYSWAAVRLAGSYAYCISKSPSFSAPWMLSCVTRIIIFIVCSLLGNMLTTSLSVNFAYKRKYMYYCFSNISELWHELIIGRRKTSSFRTCLKYWNVWLHILPNHYSLELRF